MSPPFGLLQGAAPALTEHRIADIFRPLATPADHVYGLALLVFGITAGIFLVVAGLLAYVIWKFRARPGDDLHEPAQIYGSNQIELAWTVIPIIIVFILLGVTARVVLAIENAKPPRSAVQATIIGHQWWWEVRYPDLGVVTANEVHVPVSENANDNPTFLRLESVDVIHSFWVPQLAGKTDVIPNRSNHMWIDPREPGTYFGNCAEYCGTQHANMLLRVVVHPKGDFEKWVSEQKQTVAEDPQISQARGAYESLACVTCHNIEGTVSNGKFGPDLTHLMSRKTIGAGVVNNTPKNLRAWVDDPQDIKPGCLMPNMKLTDQQLDQVIAYLETLK